MFSHIRRDPHMYFRQIPMMALWTMNLRRTGLETGRAVRNSVTIDSGWNEGRNCKDETGPG
jgi:hypothetical protein